MKNNQKKIKTNRPVVYYPGYDLYGSIQLDNVNIEGTSVLRDTQERFQKFNIKQDDLKGKTVLDLGCNLGHMLFEASKYGPKASFGIEAKKSMVNTATEIAQAANLNEQLKFITFDLNNLDTTELQNLTGFSTFDVVFACAIDFYMRDKLKFYALLAAVTSEVLYFEPDAPGLVDVPLEEIQRLKDAGIYEHLDTTSWRGEVKNSPDKVIDLLKSLGFTSIGHNIVVYREADNRFRRVFIARK